MSASEESEEPAGDVAASHPESVPVLMLGHGWFPDQLGGLNRYYCELLEQLPEATGVVLGPGADAPERVRVVSDHSAPIWRRLASFTGAARQLGRSAQVVDAHFALCAVLALRFTYLRRVPLLIHFQGPWADENVAAGDGSPLHRRARRSLERAVYRRADLAVTLTGAFRQILVERYGVSPWKTTVLAPGVDLEAFSPGDREAARAHFGLGQAEFVVCCARRLTPRVGIDVLIDAFAGVSGARLLIAGAGEQREALERQIELRGLGATVELLGRVSDDDLRALYRAADVNVVPSLSFEGFGLTVLEAAASGTPSIVSDAGGLPEAVTGLGASLVVSAGDASALSERLSRASAGELPSRDATRAWAAERSWERVAIAHRVMLSRVASGSPRPGRRLRVVYIDHVAQMSGGEIALVNLLAGLDEVEPHVILAEDGPLVGRLHQAGVSVEVLPMNDRTRLLRRGATTRLPITSVIDTVTYSLRLALRLRRIKPDLVHTNSLKAGVYGSVAARLAGIPVLWHLRDRLADDYLPAATAGVTRALIKRVPQAVVCNSESTRDTLRLGGTSAVVSRVIGEALEMGSLARSPPAHGSGPLTVVMVGRLTPWKGQDVFLRAFAAAFPDGSEQARIVGAPLFGSDEIAYAHGLKLLAGELGIADRVEFLGHRDDVRALIDAADVLVHASVTPEPFGQVVIEGMAAGIAVVAADAGGPRELIRDGIDGLLSPPGDVASLAGHLRRVDAEPAFRRRLGAAALGRAREFAPDVIAAQMMTAYRQLLAGRPDPSDGT